MQNGYEMTPNNARGCVETMKHRHRVAELVLEFAQELVWRALDHDKSKCESPELECFGEITPLLKTTTYGSDEYNATLARMKPAIEHHQAHNRHHPEYHGGRVEDMTLIDMLEMLCDWKAAGERHADGSMAKSLEINRKRFSIPDAVFGALCLTVNQTALFQNKTTGEAEA